MFGKRRKAALEVLQRKLGLSPPTDRVLNSRNVLVGVVDKFPVEVTWDPGGEGSDAGFSVVLLVVGLPPALSIRPSYDQIWKWRRRWWTPVSCGDGKRLAAQAEHMTDLEPFFTPERTAALCGLLSEPFVFDDRRLLLGYDAATQERPWSTRSGTQQKSPACSKPTTGEHKSAAPPLACLPGSPHSVAAQPPA